MSTRRFSPALLLAAGLLAAALGATTAGASAGVTTLVSADSAGNQGNGHSFDPAVSADGRAVAFGSDATNLVAADTNGTTDVFVHDGQTGATTRVSVSSGGGQANGASFLPAVSGDARFIAFQSDASNLVRKDTNGVTDVFVRDRQTGATTRVSISTGGAQANGPSVVPAISADGRFVAFESAASNLAGGDTNARRDVFLHDRQVGTTIRVSLSSAGAQGNGDSRFPAISDDGSTVAFQSDASNLVAGDGNATSDVFVYTRLSATTERVSVSSAGAEATGDSQEAALSADGRFVSFWSHATNLVTGDGNGVADVFVRDRHAGTTTRASVLSDGSDGTGIGLSGSLSSAISDDGRFVAFESDSFGSCDPNTGLCGTFNIYLRDLVSGTTTAVGSTPSGQPPNSFITEPAISGDGRFVAFQSPASNLVAGDTNDREDVFVHDRLG